MIESHVDITTVAIPAGTFRMGDAQGASNEQPVHEVYVSVFEMAVLPVTNRQYAAFLMALDYEAPKFWREARFTAPKQPVVGVSWFDAAAYCQWLRDRTGLRWRLPTEAEREKAARGGVEGLRYPCGDAAGAEGGHVAQEAPHDVGRCGPNGYGLFDMACNVHEWCDDWYAADYYQRLPSTDPQGPPSGTRRASRGGAWRHQIKVSRNAARSSLDPTFRYNDYGFRLVCTVR
ncbi:MAG: SUMF1/EgtB/PvdO family nonheme iron enzyme [Dehalococcoidia bacterium]